MAKKSRLKAEISNRYTFRYMSKEEREEAYAQKYANGCAVVFIIVLLAFCIPSCIDGINNPSSYRANDYPRYNSSNSSYYEKPKHSYMTEPGRAYLEGFAEQLIKEETGLDSRVEMKYNENTDKIYFDVKYRD